MNKGWIAVGAAAVLILGFQNCSDFALQDQVLYEQGLYDSREALDAKTLPKLLNSESLLAWSKPGQPNFVNKGLILADQWSVIAAVDRDVTGTIVTVNSGGGSEESTLSVVSGKIRATRTNGGASEYLQVDLPSTGDKMVLAAAFGLKAGEISLLVNGVVQSGTLVKSGTIGEFSLITKQITASNKVSEYVLYAGDSRDSVGKLSKSELNVMSRYVADNNMIPNVIYDPALLNEDTGGGTTVNPKFLLAKAIFDNKCITCHRAGGDYPNLTNLKESTAVANNWVYPGNPEGSKLYNALQGSTGNGLKTMPKSGSISAAEVQTIADWINSIGQ